MNVDKENRMAGERIVISLGGATGHTVRFGRPLEARAFSMSFSFPIAEHRGLLDCIEQLGGIDIIPYKRGSHPEHEVIVLTSLKASDCLILLMEELPSICDAYFRSTPSATAKVDDATCLNDSPL